jgi:hypothetical protein
LLEPAETTKPRNDANTVKAGKLLRRERGDQTPHSIAIL